MVVALFTQQTMRRFVLLIPFAVAVALCVACSGGVGVNASVPPPKFDKSKLTPKPGETEVKAAKRAFGAGGIASPP
jgi:hypothetical protein